MEYRLLEPEIYILFENNDIAVLHYVIRWTEVIKNKPSSISNVSLSDLISLILFIMKMKPIGFVKFTKSQIILISLSFYVVKNRQIYNLVKNRFNQYDIIDKKFQTIKKFIENDN